tara:strand:- start:115 stop:609 length:495 start_codon:yes stop_codon:yes gene_type:complete
MTRPDTLTQDIGVLKRREVEARILAPVVEAMSDAFGREPVMAILKETIIRIAQEQGAEMATAMGGCDSATFLSSLEAWTRGNALEIDVLREEKSAVDFNVKRCRYAEMYRELGIPELGAVLSCNRDHAMIEGFAPEATLERTQTILSGASHCDFRYQFPDTDSE